MQGSRRTEHTLTRTTNSRPPNIWCNRGIRAGWDRSFLQQFGGFGCQFLRLNVPPQTPNPGSCTKLIWSFSRSSTHLLPMALDCGRQTPCSPHSSDTCSKCGAEKLCLSPLVLQDRSSSILWRHPAFLKVLVLVYTAYRLTASMMSCCSSQESQRRKYESGIRLLVST